MEWEKYTVPDPLAWKDAVLQYMQGNSPSGKKFSGRGSDGAGGVYSLFADLSSKGAAAGTLLGGVPIAKTMKLATGSMLDDLMEPLIKRLGPERLKALEKYMGVMGSDDLTDDMISALQKDAGWSNKANDEALSYIDDIFEEGVRHKGTGMPESIRNFTKHGSDYDYGASFTSPSSGERVFLPNSPGNMTPDAKTEFILRIFEYLKDHPR
jgi:hypothetical protein